MHQRGLPPLNLESRFELRKVEPRLLQVQAYGGLYVWRSLASGGSGWMGEAKPHCAILQFFDPKAEGDGFRGIAE